VPEFETLVVPLGSTWVSLARARGVFERDVLPAHLARTRWYPDRSPSIIQPKLTSAIPFCDIGDNRPWLAFFETVRHGASERYLLPLQIEWVRFDRERYNPNALAAVRQGAREGTLLDVATDHIFIALLLRNLSQSLTTEEGGLRLAFRPTTRFPPGPIRQPERIRVLESDVCCIMAQADSDYVVRIYRRLETGIDPEAEIGRYLTDVAGFPNAPPLLGSVELIEGNGDSAIANVHAFVEHQGDAWTVTSAYLDRFVDDHRVLRDRDDAADNDEVTPYLRYLAQAGRRVAELHSALADRPELPDFAPEPIEPDDVRGLVDDLAARADAVCETLAARRASIKDSDLPLVDRVLAQRPTFRERLRALLPDTIDALRIRHHGDLHLGRMLIVKDDIFITGFGGEASRTLNQRRSKVPAARDVAALIRSIDRSVVAAQERALKGGPDEQGRLAAALSLWREHSTAAFLSGYHDSLAHRGLWPADRAAADVMLSFFLLERTLSELEYELAHRPDRLRAALAAVIHSLPETTGETP
jgi:maltose alpha-D-glucosyltransferase/alpha-amylase